MEAEEEADVLYFAGSELLGEAVPGEQIFEILLTERLPVGRGVELRESLDDGAAVSLVRLDELPELERAVWTVEIRRVAAGCLTDDESTGGKGDWDGPRQDRRRRLGPDRRGNRFRWSLLVVSTADGHELGLVRRLRLGEDLTRRAVGARRGAEESRDPAAKCEPDDAAFELLCGQPKRPGYRFGIPQRLVRGQGPGLLFVAITCPALFG
jgi:hypothetical protein